MNCRSDAPLPDADQLRADAARMLEVAADLIGPDADTLRRCAEALAVLAGMVDPDSPANREEARLIYLAAERERLRVLVDALDAMQDRDARAEGGAT